VRKRISSGSPYEEPIGFSRAIRVDDRVFVSGTAPVGAESADAAEQTRRCLEIIS
jgi:enamine deaminase RidA (YjgF/YER057c/UK114 family)